MQFHGNCLLEDFVKDNNKWTISNSLDNTIAISNQKDWTKKKKNQNKQNRKDNKRERDRGHCRRRKKKGKKNWWRWRWRWRWWRQRYSTRVTVAVDRESDVTRPCRRPIGAGHQSASPELLGKRQRKTKKKTEDEPLWPPARDRSRGYRETIAQFAAKQKNTTVATRPRRFTGSWLVTGPLLFHRRPSRLGPQLPSPDQSFCFKKKYHDNETNSMPFLSKP